VSIGFRALEGGVELLKEGGLKFNSWEWLELSLVPIPAQPEAVIQSFKSMDAAQVHRILGTHPSDSEAERLALIHSIKTKAAPAPGHTQRSSAAPSKSSPGASGKTSLSIFSKDTAMKTTKELIQALEASRAAKAARLTALTAEVTTKGETMGDGPEGEEFDTLTDEIDAIDKDLTRYRKAEKFNIDSAVVVDKVAATNVDAADRARSGIMSVKANIEPGIRFARMAMCVARAKYFQKEGHYMSPEDIYRAEKRWMDTAPEVPLAMKTAVNANDSTTAGGASEWAYAQNIASEFVEYLRPLTLLGKIQGWRSVPFNVRVGGMSGGTSAGWIGQGLAIGASRPTSTSFSLGITKVAGLSVITKELAMLSTPSAELMIRNDLARAIQQQADTSLIDPNSGGVSNVTPQSLTYGATARQASGTDFAAFKADWKNLTSNFYANNIPLAGAVVIMKEELAEALSLMVTSLGLPQFPSMQDWSGR
jgi:HK97 family phage major capsid protein